jgi:glycerol-1-phosphate dehydrogenase [NAD(P)+]
VNLEEAVSSARVTRGVVVERDAIRHLPRVVREIDGSRACQVIADPATMHAAGDRVLEVLRAANCVLEEPIILNEVPRLKPRADTARAVAQRLQKSRAHPLAVGAGVINDVTKYAAEIAGASYISVATAASMDGYAGSGAAMLDDGFKRTLACRPPIAIVADLDVISRAPFHMAGWGYGDLAGKLIAGADWILADAVAEDPIDPASFRLVQDHVKDWLSEPAAIAAHDPDALRGLVDGLLISGFAMQARGDSRPASGSEHQLSHLWEMDGVEANGEPAAHGACVGVATVAMLALYTWFLEQDVSTTTVKTTKSNAQSIEDELGKLFPDAALIESARVETTAKLKRANGREARVAALIDVWPNLKTRLRETLVPLHDMERMLAAANAAFRPSDLGIGLDKLARDYRRARLIRRRYTILDCLEDLGWLDVAIEAAVRSERSIGRAITAPPRQTSPS